MIIRCLLGLAACSSVTLAIAQLGQQSAPETHVNALGQTVTVVRPTSFMHTPPVSEWPVVDLEATEVREISNHRAHREDVRPEALPQGMDPARQEVIPWRSAVDVGANFPGNNSTGLPPDPTGAAGPTRYVQAVNTAYRVFSKSGTSIAGPFALSTLWPGSTNEGDPIVLWDRHAERWFISQFQSGPNGIRIAVSETSDPIGSYYAYSFNLNQFPDYPKYSVWWDGYYMTSNSNATAVVFDRAKMLAGDPTASMIALSAPSLGTAGFRSVLPADADGDLPPNGTPCYFFNLEDDGWFGVNQDRIKVYEMDVDWNVPANTNVSISQTIPVQPFSTNFGSGFSNIAQPGTSQRLDAVAQIFYFRAQHMRFVDHSSVMLCHVVDVNGQDLAGIRWYELRDNNDGNWSVHQQATFSPDGANRWMASMAMDVNGNIALGYSYTDPANGEFPGLRYTGRYADDPLGTMTLAEGNAISGSAAQTGFNRYGDYAHMSLDPNGTTFWFTGEYLSLGGQARTRIFSLDLSAAVGVDELALREELSLSHYQTGDQLYVSLRETGSANALGLDVIGMDGRVVRTVEIRPAGGSWNGSIWVGDLPDAAYFLRVRNAQQQQVERFVITR
ncbi:MAG: hypothetical protein KDB88_06835 [Flavobacteriales bacterium]|nr:hypothetical protein [Flavobacteriales bacterium]